MNKDHGNYKEITGVKYNKLTAVKYVKTRKGNIFWLFTCSCGTSKIIAKGQVMSGKTKSCGCLGSGVKKRHGLSHTKFHNTWLGLKGRCLNPKSTSFSRYGGRGIRCHWIKFDDFFEDMYSSFQYHVKKFGEKNTTIDRIDNNGNYCKENCRWATKKEQALNRRSNHFIILNGISKTVTEWCSELGIDNKQAFQRLASGWSPEDVFK